MKHYTLEQAKELPMKSYYKKVLVRARQLTNEDFQRHQGKLPLKQETPFAAGDYLCSTQDNMWVIPRVPFETRFKQLHQPDSEGFGVYRLATKIWAMAMPEDFTITGPTGALVTGKAGDFLAHIDIELFAIEAEVFNREYAPL